MQVLNGRFEVMDVAEVVRPEPNSPADRERLDNDLHLTLLVRGEEGETIDTVGISWDLPNFFREPVERPEMWGKYCVEVLKTVVANSKPRHALRDALLTMKTVVLREELGFTPWMYMNAGGQDFERLAGDPSRPV
jgi:hypothetical protein